MEFKYKCPVCRANNILTSNNLQCRRCKSDLTSIYRIKQKKLFEGLKKIGIIRFIMDNNRIINGTESTGIN